jgi:hypothetical protein
VDDLRAQLTQHRCIKSLVTAGVVLAVTVGCARYDANATTDSAFADSVARARVDSVTRAQPGYVVDSIFPIEEEIRRFNAELVRPDSLVGGARSRAELLRLFEKALARQDTSGLQELLVSRSEFGYFVFPESPYARAPYKTKPAIVWMQLVSDSERGLSRLLARVAHNQVRISNLECLVDADREGRNRYWRNCTVNLRDNTGASRRLQLFGQIVERDGRMKFLSYSTDF